MQAVAHAFPFGGIGWLLHPDLLNAPGIQLAISSIEGADGEVEVFDYPGTKHAFFNDERPEVYDGAAADAAWTRTVDFFHSKLG